MATIKQIAKMSNVSMSTVSRVLNRDETIVVSTQVKNKIFDIAHELNYIPPKERRLKMEKGITIGIADWRIIRREIDNMNLLDYMRIASRYYKEPIEFKRMTYGKPMQVDGIIALGKLSTEEVSYLKQQSYSILFINSSRHDYQYDRIIMDYDEGLVQMVNYVLEEKQYESLGYIGGYFKSENLTIGQSRHNALVKILEKKEKYNQKLFLIGEMSKDSGYDLAKEAIRANCLARAVLIGNDHIAEGVLQAFQEEGISVPEDVDIIIYKDIETLRSKFPTYMTIQMFPSFVWETAIKLILERITGARNDTMTVILPSRFCIK